MRSSPWLIRRPNQAGKPRRIRLYCFCYAGGSASIFIPWQAALDPAIEVCGIQLPGRGARMAEKPHSGFPTLIETLAGVIGNQDKLPFAFFGHSLGALLAFEVARYFKVHHMPMPERLFASACNAPQLRNPSKGLAGLPDDALIDALKDYNGTPRELLEHRELMELVLPTIRADFALVENYQYRAMPLLTIPITVLAGKLDVNISPEQAAGWSRETTNTCSVQWFEDDHFFINTERQRVLDCINAELAKV